MLNSSIGETYFHHGLLGITWSLVTLLGGLIYLAYDERKRRNFQLKRKNSTVELENSFEATKEE